MRGTDQHLTIEEIEQLTAPAADFASGALEGAMRHLDSCEQCRFRMLFVQNSADSDFGEALAAGRPSSQSHDDPSGCPEESRWLELAAGALPKQEGMQYVEHAAACSHCGPLLKAAIEDLGTELTPDEETKVASLSSANPVWQESLVARITGAPVPKAEAKQETPRRTPAFWPRWAFAATAAAVAAVAGWWGWIQFRTQSVDALLAQAYTDQRTIEVRIPGAKYAPMRVERGAGVSNLSKTPALLKAEALIGENLSKNPDNPVWLQAKARADLLDGNYEPAVQSLLQALEAQPDSAALLTDLGSAYLLRGESAGHATDYGNAVESLSKALAKSPNDPIILFNHALACEKFALFSQAIADWEHYLRVEPSGGWSDEARANLLRVKEEMAKREQRAATSLLSPREVVVLMNADREGALTALDKRAERYLEVAVQSWLPQAYGLIDSSQGTSAEASRALQGLAELLRDRHDDTWLSDFLEHQPDPIQIKALRSLVASDEALRGGRYGLSIELATKSLQDFRRSSNQAGMLRASFALMLAQTFALKFNECLKAADATIPSLLITRHRWLQIQTFIQQGQCLHVMSQIEKSIGETSRAAELAQAFHYPGLELRAVAFAAGYLRDTGNADRGLHDLIHGLATFWHSEVTNTRGENLYSVLFSFAGATGWHHLEALALAEKIADFPTIDPVDEAVSWQLLAGANERAEDYAAAGINLRRASVRLASLPNDSGVDARRVEIALEEAGIQLHLGNPKGALATVAELRRQFDIPAGLFKADYLRVYGEALLGLSRDAEAKPLLAQAVSIVERGLRDLQSETDKLQWSRTESQIYRDLLTIALKSGSSSEGFALWEWYKGASLRVTLTDNLAESNDNRERSFLPSGESSYGLTHKTVLVSYVVLRDSTAVFLVRDGKVRVRTLLLTGDPELRVRRFLGFCADPSTDLSAFNTESRRLYELLVAPIVSDIQDATEVRFETDGILDRIPFELLQGPDGRYLIDRFTVTYSPGLAYISGSKPARLSAAETASALIVVGSAAQEPSLSPLPEATEEGRDVAGFFQQATIIAGEQATHDNVLRGLRNAAVFHFIGHGSVGSGQVALVIGPGVTISSQDLVKLHLHNLRLAVLSACNTANGNNGTPSDMDSIARTLAVAGVPQTVASRWRIDSVVSRQVMRAFYSNFASGKSPADSLRKAMIAVRNLPGYQHPYYWGSFAVFGSSESNV